MKYIINETDKIVITLKIILNDISNGIREYIPKF